MSAFVAIHTQQEKYAKRLPKNIVFEPTFGKKSFTFNELLTYFSASAKLEI